MLQINILQQMVWVYKLEKACSFLNNSLLLAKSVLLRMRWYDTRSELDVLPVNEAISSMDNLSAKKPQRITSAWLNWGND